MSKESSVMQHLHSGQMLSHQQQLQMVINLSVPAILAQISTTIMQYIDAAMVGSLGANASASIGLIASSMWLFNGLCTAAAAGFAVQVAQFVGAGQKQKAQEVFRQSLGIALIFGLLFALAGTGLSGYLPGWLGGKAEICKDAARYFFIYSCVLPANQFRQLTGSMLQCCGDIKTPSMLNILMCAMDVVFNSFLIFPTRQYSLLGQVFTLPGAGLGVAGAALGTALSEVVTTLLMGWAACLRSDYLHFKWKGPWKPNLVYYKIAARISFPLAFEHFILSSSQLAAVHIVASLGTIAMAANALAITAESLCYMPGYGIAAAATTLVGQSLGAGRRDLARSFARLSVLLGVVVMSVTGLLMFLFTPSIFAMLTPDQEVRLLGSQVLRIEAFAEPLFSVSIVAAGAMRGAGDTKIPSLINLVSIWGVRITSARYLAARIGLHGVWIAISGELCIRGLMFLIRLLREKWLDQMLIVETPFDRDSDDPL